MRDNSAEWARTIKGYDMFEASSAFQKAIRRGDEDSALFWMAEFYDSGKAEYLWKRMMIICAEDIGLAEPSIHTHVRELYASFKWMLEKNDKKKSERMFLVQAVLMMVRCRKSRLVDWALNVTWDSHFETRMEIPDYAIDMHSRKGKAMGKTVNDFINVGSHLENHRELDRETEYKEWCRERWNAMAGCNPDGTKNDAIDANEVLYRMGRLGNGYTPKRNRISSPDKQAKEDALSDDLFGDI